MNQVTRRMSPLTSLLGIVIVVALAAPLTSFADTSTPANSIGIPSQNDRPAQLGRNHRVGSPGHIGGEGGNPVQPVPEPGTMALMGMGVMALGATIRKRWKR